jgi:hypothetical protein
MQGTITLPPGVLCCCGMLSVPLNIQHYQAHPDSRTQQSDHTMCSTGMINRQMPELLVIGGLNGRWPVARDSVAEHCGSCRGCPAGCVLQRQYRVVTACAARVAGADHTQHPTASGTGRYVRSVSPASA